jgi:hypothetical protein
MIAKKYKNYFFISIAVKKKVFLGITKTEFINDTISIDSVNAPAKVMDSLAVKKIQENYEKKLKCPVTILYYIHLASNEN